MEKCVASQRNCIDAEQFWDEYHISCIYGQESICLFLSVVYSRYTRPINSIVYFCNIKNTSYQCEHFQKYSLWARSYMFSVHDPVKMFSRQVLGTRVFRLRALWMFSVPLRLDLKSAHISVCAIYLLCIHCATCEVILTCTLHADSSLRAKPRPVSTCSRFHIVQTSFRRHTKGAICSENMVWPCSSWNCSSGNTTL